MCVSKPPARVLYWRRPPERDPLTKSGSQPHENTGGSSRKQKRPRPARPRSGPKGPKPSPRAPPPWRSGHHRHPAAAPTIDRPSGSTASRCARRRREKNHTAMEHRRRPSRPARLATRAENGWPAAADASRASPGGTHRRWRWRKEERGTRGRRKCFPPRSPGGAGGLTRDGLSGCPKKGSWNWITTVHISQQTKLI